MGVSVVSQEVTAEVMVSIAGKKQVFQVFKKTSIKDQAEVVAIF